MSTPLPDTGARSTFATGAVRDAMTGKGLPSCIPPIAIRKMAKRFEDGSSKYGLFNWVKGIPLSRYVDSITRHMLDFQEGCTKEDHLGAVLWNAACLAWTEQAIKDGKLPKELDDLAFREIDAQETPPAHEFGDFNLHDGLQKAVEDMGRDPIADGEVDHGAWPDFARTYENGKDSPMGMPPFVGELAPVPSDEQKEVAEKTEDANVSAEVDDGNPKPFTISGVTPGFPPKIVKYSGKLSDQGDFQSLKEETVKLREKYKGLPCDPYALCEPFWVEQWRNSPAEQRDPWWKTVKDYALEHLNALNITQPDGEFSTKPSGLAIDQVPRFTPSGSAPSEDVASQFFPFFREVFRLKDGFFYRLYSPTYNRMVMDIGEGSQLLQETFKWDATRKCFLNDLGQPVENVAYFA